MAGRHDVWVTPIGATALNLLVRSASVRKGTTASAAGKFSFRVLEAGQERAVDVTLPTDKSGDLTGPGAQDRYRFPGLSGDKVTLKSATDCTTDESLYWAWKARAAS